MQATRNFSIKPEQQFLFDLNRDLETIVELRESGSNFGDSAIEEKLSNLERIEGVLKLSKARDFFKEQQVYQAKETTDPDEIRVFTEPAREIVLAFFSIMDNLIRLEQDHPESSDIFIRARTHIEKFFKQEFSSVSTFIKAAVVAHPQAQSWSDLVKLYPGISLYQFCSAEKEMIEAIEQEKKDLASFVQELELIEETLDAKAKEHEAARELICANPIAVDKLIWDDNAQDLKKQIQRILKAWAKTSDSFLKNQYMLSVARLKNIQEGKCVNRHSMAGLISPCAIAAEEEAAMRKELIIELDRRINNYSEQKRKINRLRFRIDWFFKNFDLYRNYESSFKSFLHATGTFSDDLNRLFTRDLVTKIFPELNLKTSPEQAKDLQETISKVISTLRTVVGERFADIIKEFKAEELAKISGALLRPGQDLLEIVSS